MRERAFNIVSDKVAFDWYSAPWEAQFNGFRNYVMDDTRYKNEVRVVYTSGIQNHLQATIEYRNKAVVCYQKIVEILDLPVDKTLFGYEPDVAKLLLGNWESEGSPGIKTTVYIQDDALFYKDSLGANKGGQLIFLSKTNYDTTDGVYCAILQEGDTLLVKTNEAAVCRKVK
jgi:hypothetical protein